MSKHSPEYDMTQPKTDVWTYSTHPHDLHLYVSAEDNARLMKAAPSLLAACKLAIKKVGIFDRQILAAAIREATGD